MTNQTSPRISQKCWMALILLLVACSQPASPTPVPSTATPLPQPAAAVEQGVEIQTFTIIPAESTASYIVDEEFFGGALAKLGIEAGEVDIVGSTQSIEGQLQLNLADLASPLGANHFTVNLTGLTTDQPRRDSWIQDDGPRFSQFPLAEFTATGVENAPTTYTDGEEASFQLLGDLTVREITQPVTFDVTAQLADDTLTGTASAQLLMTDFGIDPPSFANTLTVEDAFMVRVEFTAKAQ